MESTPAARPPATVVHVFLDFGDGGAQRLTLGICRHLDPDRFRPRLVCLRARGALVPDAEAAGIPVDVLGRLARPYDWGAVGLLARHLRSVGADIVHVPLYSRAAPYARLAARLAGALLTVAHAHGQADAEPRLRRLADHLLAPGTCFIAVSEAERTRLMRSGIPAASVHVVHPGIELARFAPGDRAAARVALGLPADRPIVLVPARLHPVKRHIDLVAALPRLVARVPEVLLLCAGGGPLARALPALVEAAGWAGQVRFLGPREDLPTLLAAADLVALASDREGLPLAILEAMAAARAVVATEVGGIAEVLSDGTTGRLVPPRVPAALADALADVLLDPAIRDAMGSQAHAVAVRRFSLDAAARRVEAIYSHELARRGGRLEAPRSGAKPWDERPARIDPDLSAGLGMALR